MVNENGNIWVMDADKGTYEQVSTFEGEDREPVFGNNGAIYYLSEKGNISQNLFKSSVTDKGNMQQLTSFTKYPVRDLSLAKNNTLCFTYNGEVYTLKEDPHL